MSANERQYPLRGTMLVRRNPRNRCENCLFWDNSAISSHSEEETGQCRRSPPGFDSRTGLAVWPFSEDRDWCGEHSLDPDLVDPNDPGDMEEGGS